MALELEVSRISMMSPALMATPLRVLTVTVGAATLVMLSELLVPESLPEARERVRVESEVGAVVSIVTLAQVAPAPPVDEGFKLVL